MTKEIEFDKDEVLKRKILQMLQEINDSFLPLYPKLDYTPMALYEAKEYQGCPLLFTKRVWYHFLAYYVHQLESGALILGLARKRNGRKWEYISTIDNFTRLVDTYSLSTKESCSFKDDLAGFVDSLPVGSFLQIGTKNGIKSLGIFRGYEQGQVKLTFGFDSKTGEFEELHDVSFEEGEMGEEVSAGFMNTSFTLDQCRRIDLLQIRGGVTGLDGLPDPDSARKAHIILETIMKTFIERRYTSVKILYRRGGLTVCYMQGKEEYGEVHYSDSVAAPFLCRLKIFAGLDQAEHERDQHGKFKYKLNDAPYSMKLRIEYPEIGSYDIFIEYDR